MIKLPVVEECLVCRIKMVKDDKGKPEETKVPCTKVEEVNNEKTCMLYPNPKLMWSKPGGCIFPFANTTAGAEVSEKSARKFGRRR